MQFCVVEECLSWKTLCTRCRENAVAGVNSPSSAPPISTGTKKQRISNTGNRWRYSPYYQSLTCMAERGIEASVVEK